MVCKPLLFILAQFLPKLNQQLNARTSALIDAPVKSAGTKRVVFLCSSAGEFEQALPIIERLNDYLNHESCFVFFHSQSGLTYAKKSKALVPYSIAPLDSSREWRRLFKKLGAEIFIVVRHELWPGFIYAAGKCGQLFLINASISKKATELPWLKRKMLGQFSNVFCLNEKDRITFQANCSGTNVLVSGDTKYDRVLSRAAQNKFKIEKLREQIETKSSFHHPKTLIIGSAWHEDIDLIFKAYRNLKFEKINWGIIVAPHDTKQEMIDWITRRCLSDDLSFTIYSKINESRNRNNSVLIVDTVGELAEFYGLANLAFIGGALHNKIHNVLEAAVYGIPIGFGPRYWTQNEASMLVENNLATSISTEEETLKWWLLSQENIADTKTKMNQYLLGRSGASALIANKLMTHLKV